MPEIVSIILLTGLAGSCILIGGILASFEHIRPRWFEREVRHFVIAFGGGILLGAVSVVLVPEGIKNMDDSLFSIPIMLLGGATFLLVERWLGLKKHDSPQLLGMMLDYVPEALALGGLVALGSPAAPLLALFIGLQNLPEGFNSYREINRNNGHKASKTLLTMSALIPLGPIAGVVGYLYLSSYEWLLGAIMLFASGGILYIIFQDIAPQSRLAKHWGPPLGAVFGFCLALFSEMLVQTN
ncbi:ZIP family metal transporter [Aliiglaciecola lipolytica]|uniref:Zinc transporter, ZIP family n=1 Tax=Aliiglaciecola lipolytica E3 TaxID=1127673 RepID=K6XX51_9ALTE|nr:zinc transporter ZIP family [Aliiglaciecola lipolytica]GAC16226.1 zinc transporter, ZIP family [Aliiglaciecola lipolytica E3]